MRSTTGGVVIVDDMPVVAALDGCSVRGLPNPLTSNGATWAILRLEGEIEKRREGAGDWTHAGQRAYNVDQQRTTVLVAKSSRCAA